MNSQFTVTILPTPAHQQRSPQIVPSGRLGYAAWCPKAFFNNPNFLRIRPTPAAPGIGDR